MKRSVFLATLVAFWVRGVAAGVFLMFAVSAAGQAEWLMAAIAFMLFACGGLGHWLLALNEADELDSIGGQA